jgi:hypothetical protein
MKKKIWFGGVLAALCMVVLSGCGTMIGAFDQDANAKRIKDGLTRATANLDGALPDGLENPGDGVYVDAERGNLYFSQDDQNVTASIYAFLVSPTGKMTDFSSGRSVQNSYGGYKTQYDEMDEAEWVLREYWEFLENENFLLSSGDGGPGTIYHKGSVYAGIYTLPQLDNGLIPLRVVFSRDLGLVRDFMK